MLIAGSRGTLGAAFAQACDARGLAYVALARGALDITDPDAVEAAIAAVEPWCVINCAGFVRVDDAERERELCRQRNVDGATALARASRAYGIKLVTFSSDLVFDGEKGAPYVESDSVRPLCEYGHTKAAAEVMVLDADVDALVVRTAAFFGDRDEANFVTQALRALAAGEPFNATTDVVVSPTYVPDLVDAALDLAIDDERGVWHLANVGAVSWHELARAAARVAGVSVATLRGGPLAELRLQARRPRYSALTSERACVMPTLDDAIARYARGRPWERAPMPPAPAVSCGPERRTSNGTITSTDARSRPSAAGAAATRSSS